MNCQKAILVTLLLFCVDAKSATFCVTTAVELRAALNSAESNSQHDEIRIEMGDYETQGTAFSYQETQGFDLEISGGWVNFFGNPCGVQGLSLIHISEPTRLGMLSRMPSSA